MALNGSLGLGFTLSAKDLATPKIRDATNALRGLTGAATEAGNASGGLGAKHGADGRWRDAKGKFLTMGASSGKAFSSGFSGALGGLFGGGGGGGGGGGLGGLGLGGLGAMLPGVGVVAGLMSASNAATEFGHKMGLVKTVLGSTALSTKQVQDMTMGLAATYGIDALQQANGLYETLSAGITDAKQATELLGMANKFAVGGSTDLKGSVDVLTSAVNTYRDKGLTATQASDQMFTAIAEGKTTASQLAQSLGEVAPVAHAAGVSFGELQSAIATLTVEGIKTPQAMTGLNAMMSNLMKPTSEASTEAKRLGIEFNATALKSKGLHGVLAQLNGNTKINDETFVKLFGSVDGVKTAMTLTSNGGAKFTEVMGKMAQSAGATDRAFAIMAETTKFQADRFDAAKKNAMILVGQGLEPMQVAVLKVANGILENFAKIPAPVRNAMIVAAAAVGLLGSAFLVLGGPVAFLVAAVVAGGFAIKHAIDNNLGGLGDKWNSAVGTARLVWDSFVQLFTQGGFSGAVRKELNSAENGGIKAFVIGTWVWLNRLKNFFVGVGAGFTAGLNAAKPAFDAFGSALDRLGAALGLTTANDPAANVAKWEQWGQTGEKIGGMVAGAMEDVVSAMTHAMDFVSGFTSTFEGIKPTFDSVRASGAQLTDAIGRLLAGLGFDKLDASTMSWSRFGAIVGGVVSGQLQTARDAIATISRVVDGLATAMGGVSKAITGTLTGDWTMAWEGMKQTVLGVVKAILAIVTGMVQKIAEGIDALGKMGNVDLGAGAHARGFIDSMNNSLDESLGMKLGQAGNPVSFVDPNMAKFMAAPPKATAASTSTNADVLAAVRASQMSPGIGLATMPGMGGFGAAMQAQRRSGPLSVMAGPVTVNVTMDGQQMAGHMTKIQHESAQRSGGDMPAPSE